MVAMRGSMSTWSSARSATSGLESSGVTKDRVTVLSTRAARWRSFSWGDAAAPGVVGSRL